MITVDQFRSIMPHARSKVPLFADALNDAMDEFEVSTPQRQAAFLAQVAHESGELRYVEELASGAAYEGREDLGNTEPGDGIKFKGRGLIQITGRANYMRCGSALGLDLLAYPELLEAPSNAARSAAWFWKSHGCNELADADNFRKITLRINGGLNGQEARLAYWEVAKEVLA
jgi:putative chitinase